MCARTSATRSPIRAPGAHDDVATLARAGRSRSRSAAFGLVGAVAVGAGAPLAGPGRADGAAPDGLNLDDVAGVRGGDDLAATDVESDVVAPSRSPEHEVAGLHGVERHVRERRILRTRVVRHAHAGRAPGPHGEPGAVEAAGPGAGVAVRLAELGPGVRDGRPRSTADRGVSDGRVPGRRLATAAGRRRAAPG